MDPIRCYHSKLECIWEQWQWRGTPYSPKLQHYWSLTIRLFSVISRTHIGKSYPSAEMQSVYSKFDDRALSVWFATILNSLKTFLQDKNEFCYKPIPNNPEFSFMELPPNTQKSLIYWTSQVYIKSSTDRSISFDQNSSVWLNILASRSWDRNPVDSNANPSFYLSATRKQ